MAADYVVLGKVFTSDDKQLYTEGFAIQDGKILEVGTKEDVMKCADDSTEILEYTDEIIIPGITEGHAHVSSTIEIVMGPLVNGESIEECQQMIKDFADTHPGNGPIFGGGFDPGLFGPEGPTADLIDAVVKDRVVILSDEGHHSVWVNTKAMEVSGITKDTPDPENGQINHYPNGEPSGFLQELAIALVNPAMPEIGIEQYKEAILYYQDMALSHGITSAFEPMLSHTHDEALRFDAYGELCEEKKLKITFRVAPTLNPPDDPDTFFDFIGGLNRKFKEQEKLQVHTVKFFTDGVVDGHTALLREPYKMEPLDCGPLMYEQEELNQRAMRAIKEGYNIHIHAIGDAAIDQALEAFEKAQSVPSEREYRNAITHLQVVQPDQPKRMKDLGVVAVVNPYWHYETPLYEPLEKPFLGEERAQKMYYVNSFLKEGVHMSTASDFPVTVPPDTMFCLHMMVNRFEPKTSKEPYFPEECIDVESALKCMTIGGAYQNYLEEKKGSITKGKDADFVVLSQDVTTIPKQDIYKTKVEETWIQGEKLFHM